MGLRTQVRLYEHVCRLSFSPEVYCTVLVMSCCMQKGTFGLGDLCPWPEYPSHPWGLRLVVRLASGLE